MSDRTLKEAASGNTAAPRTADPRMALVIELLQRAPLDELHSFLDIGFGEGQLTEWLCEKGKSVTATGLDVDSYGADVQRLRNEYGVRIEECRGENMPFADKSFDAVVMSHVLEHCPNVQLALQEVRRVVADHGYLFVFVPPHNDHVSAGHISVGWNIGQLMYVLLLNGFDVKNGSFLEAGCNVAAFVRKNLSPLPPLRGDKGDIGVLNQHQLFPRPVESADGRNDGFYGAIESMNWEHRRRPQTTGGGRKAIKKLLISSARMIPKRARLLLSGKLETLVRILKYESVDGKNPSALR